MSTLPGIIDGRYQPIRRLGDGAAGVVYHAHDLLLDTEVALKVVLPHLAVHPRFRARFAREVALGARLTHPNLVPVHDMGVLPEGQPWVAMGYAAGGSLDDLLDVAARTDMDVEERNHVVLHVLAEVLDGLAAIHAHGMLHQDLKPENVLITPGPDGMPSAWIADLGVADAFAEATRETRASAGTPTWMAPEQLMGRSSELGPSTDLYAFGLILWKALTGEVPHLREGNLVAARMRGRPTLPPGKELPPPLLELLGALLDPDPAARLDHAADAARALRAARSGTMLLDLVGDRDEDTGTPRIRVRPSALPDHPPLPYVPPEATRLSASLVALRPRVNAGGSEARDALWREAVEVSRSGGVRVVMLVDTDAARRRDVARSFVRELACGGWMRVTTLRYHEPAGADDGYRGAVRALLAPWQEHRDQLVARLTRNIARERGWNLERALPEAVRLARWCGHLEEGDAGVRDDVALRYLHAHLASNAAQGSACLLMEEAHLAQAEGDGLSLASLLGDGGTPSTLVLVTLDPHAVERDTALRSRVEALTRAGAARIDVEEPTLAVVRESTAATLALAPELAQVLEEEQVTLTLDRDLLLRTWAARGLLVRREGAHAYALRSDVDLAAALPPDRATLAQRRIASAVQRSPDPRAAADALSLLALAGEAPPTPLLRGLEDAGIDALIAAGLVLLEGGALVFEHVHVAEEARAIAEARPDAPRLHRRLAEAWQVYARRTGTDVRPKIGLHLLRGGAPSDALHPLLWAVRALNEAGRGREAIRTAALAVEAAEHAGHGSSLMAARRLHAEALLENGEVERAAALARFALASAQAGRDTDNTPTQLRLLLARAARESGDLAGCARELDLVEHTVIPGTAVHRQLLAQRARLLGASNDLEGTARAWGTILTHEGVEPSVHADALCGHAEALARAHKLDAAYALTDALQRIVHDSDDLRRAPEALVVLATIALYRDESERAAAFLHDALSRASRIGAEALVLKARLLLATAARREELTNVAHTAATSALHLAQARSHTVALATARLERAILAEAQGDLSSMALETDAAAEALARSPRHSLWLYVSVLRVCASAGRTGFEPRWAIARARGLPDSGAPVDLHPALARLERTLRASEQNAHADAVAAARSAPRPHEVLGLLPSA